MAFLDLEKGNISSSSTHTASSRVLCRRFVFAAFVLSLMLLAMGCSSSQEKEPVPLVTVQAAAVKIQTIENEISTDAILYPHDQAAIVPKVTAPIKKLYVTRGSRVHAGEVLATIEESDLKGALTESQGAYQQAEATYNSALQSAEHDLQIAKEQFEAAQSVYDSRVSLYKQGAASQKDVQDAQIALSQTSNQYGLAQKQYNLKSARGAADLSQGQAGRCTSAGGLQHDREPDRWRGYGSSLLCWGNTASRSSDSHRNGSIESRSSRVLERGAGGAVARRRRGSTRSGERRHGDRGQSHGGKPGA